MPLPPEEELILDVWQENAEAWTEAVRAGRIASRTRVTDAAILSAVRRRMPATLLDIGCGEGWLARALAADGIAVHGIDAVPALLDEARASAPGTYEELSYQALAAGAPLAPVDVAVCNFSLLGDQSTRGVLMRVPQLLRPGGTLLIQTLHPLGAAQQGYAEGWRAGSWAGCSGAFGRAAPWYFRPLGAWIALLSEAGLQLEALLEPLDPDSGLPCSVIFEAAVRRRGAL
ncbi:class I SAM-dependent methyltransferase [Azotobacter sp. CWF10]